VASAGALTAASVDLGLSAECGEGHQFDVRAGQN
jgi:hypothetical protein